jgi:hypothetical protein
MSVSIAGAALVAVASDLDTTYPGGNAAFIAAVALLDPPVSACESDGHVVSVRFHDDVHAHAVVKLLAAPIRWVLMNAEGPMTPAPWLRWSRRGGATRAWLVNRKAGARATPHENPPVESAVRGSEGMLQIAVEDGIATYLDLETGTHVRAELPSQEPEPAPSSETPLHDALISAIDRIGWYHHFSHAPSAMVDFIGAAALYATKFHANESGELLVCFTRAPVLVPLPARRRVMDFITRANFGMQQGGFELSLDDGMLGFRTSTHASIATLTEHMVRSMLLFNVSTLDKYSPYLMEVIYAKRTPREAVEAAERE